MPRYPPGIDVMPPTRDGRGGTDTVPRPGRVDGFCAFVKAVMAAARGDGHWGGGMVRAYLHGKVVPRGPFHDQWARARVEGAPRAPFVGVATRATGVPVLGLILTFLADL